MLLLPLLFAEKPPQILQTSDHAATWWEYMKAFGIGLVGVSFTYGGYQQCINFGDEVKDPSRNVPRAVFLGIAVIIILYMAVNFAYVQVIGFEQLKSAKNISSLMASHLFGDMAGKIVSILLFLSVLAYVNAVLLSNPRVMQAMSEEGVLPGIFGKRTARHNVLTTSLSVFAGLGALIVFWAETFDEILKLSLIHI